MFALENKYNDLRIFKPSVFWIFAGRNGGASERKLRAPSLFTEPSMSFAAESYPAFFL